MKDAKVRAFGLGLLLISSPGCGDGSDEDDDAPVVGGDLIDIPDAAAPDGGRDAAPPGPDAGDAAAGLGDAGGG